MDWRGENEVSHLIATHKMDTSNKAGCFYRAFEHYPLKVVTVQVCLIIVESGRNANLCTLSRINRCYNNTNDIKIDNISKFYIVEQQLRHYRCVLTGNWFYLAHTQSKHRSMARTETTVNYSPTAYVHCVFAMQSKWR